MPDKHPILFTPENVRAILEGRKTQTRRLVKLTDAGRIKKPGSPKNWHPDDANAVQACPYGMRGDRLWVRETWAIGVSTGNSWHSEDGRIKSIAEPHRYSRRYAADGTEGFCGKWRPSIFMPRWACRLVLELTEVRVERLQECSEADAIAEGVKPCGHSSFHVDEHTCSYKKLWESINGDGSWAKNPWVWVLTFKRVTA